jgi:DNA-binding transcriptional LysR family regulator
MDIKYLHYFTVVVEETNISGAAKRLHISQPPLSHAIKTMEEELGVVLMERGPRHIILTDAGETLYHRAKTILDYAETTFREIKNIGDGMGGSIRIGMISSCGAVLLPTIHRFSDAYPHIRFDIYERNTYELLDSLKSNMIELAFVRTPFQDIDRYDCLKLHTEPLLAVGQAAFFDGQREEKALPPEFFNGKPIILYRRWKRILTDFFERNGVSPFYKCFNDDARSGLMWAEAGLGVAIVPESISRVIRGNDDMCRIPIASSDLITDIFAIWKEGRYMSPALRRFIETLNAAAEKFSS